MRHVLLSAILVGPMVLPAQDAAPTAFPADPRVDAVFAEYDRPDRPGCAVGAYRDDRLIYAKGYGLADVERGVPLTSRSVFDIGSTSKQFAAAVIVLLAQEGKLRLDDDVRQYIPELPSYDAPITIRHLLHHTSGLRDYIGLLVYSGHQIDDVTTPDDALRILAKQRALNFTPGQEHLYSNSGYFLLSLIVERVTGNSLRDEAQTRIFGPLGMRHTSYLGSYDDVIPNRALAYARRGDGLRLDVSRWLQLGDGAVFTTVEDLLLWNRNFYSPTVGGQALLDTLHARGRLNDGRTLDYALGLMHGELRGKRTVHHGGSWGGYRAEFLRVPELRYGVAVLCNIGSSNPSALADAVAAVHLADALDPLPAATASAAPTSAEAVPVEVLQRYVGSYRSAGGTTVFTIVLNGGNLRLTSPAQLPLVASTPTRFRVAGAPVEVSIEFDTAPRSAAQAQRARVNVEGQPEELVSRIELVAPGVAELAAYAGSYASEELDGTWLVSVENNGLVVRYPGSAPIPLRPLTRDEFAGRGVNLLFQRNEGGTVVGAALSQGRARNMMFVRLSTKP